MLYQPFPASLRCGLGQYIKGQKARRHRYLFETHRMDKLTTRWIREIIKRYARAAGIEKRIYPHLFRHQLLTHLAKKGLIDAKIQLISGHEDRKSLAIYRAAPSSTVAGTMAKATASHLARHSSGGEA